MAALPVCRGVVGGEAAHVVHGGYGGGFEGRYGGGLRGRVQSRHRREAVDSRVAWCDTDVTNAKHLIVVCMYVCVCTVSSARDDDLVQWINSSVDICSVCEVGTLAVKVPV